MSSISHPSEAWIHGRSIVNSGGAEYGKIKDNRKKCVIVFNATGHIFWCKKVLN